MKARLGNRRLWESRCIDRKAEEVGESRNLKDGLEGEVIPAAQVSNVPPVMVFHTATQDGSHLADDIRLRIWTS